MIFRNSRKKKSIHYEFAPDIFERAKDLIIHLNMNHVRMDSISCLRSFNTRSRGTIARCHTLSKVLQLSLGRKGFYVLEFISERFDRLSEDEQTKTIIHELMHIPKSFGGGFKHHDYVCDRNIERFFQVYKSLKAKKSIYDYG